MKTLFVLYVCTLLLAVAFCQSPSPSSTSSRRPSPSRVASNNQTAVARADRFICRKVNEYNLTSWVPINNFLTMDRGTPGRWTVINRRTVHVDAKDNARPTALISREVWTGRVQFQGWFTTARNAMRTSRRIGFLFGVVSPRTRFLLLEWTNQAFARFSNSSCSTPLVATSWNLEKRGIAIKSIRNPLGQTELQQECYLYTPINQANVTSILYSNETVRARALGVNYWFNLIMDTYANTIYFEIRTGATNGTIVDRKTVFVQDHDISANFSLGKVGFWVAGGQATFYNLTVTPLTCANDWQSNCGYDCLEDPTYHYPDDDDSGLKWWGILLIILSILCCCCLIAVIVLAVLVVLKRLRG